MNRKIRHILSTLIGALICLFLKKQEEEIIPIATAHPKIITLTKDNIHDIEKGTWLIFTQKYQPELSNIKEHQNIRYAIIVLDSIDKAEIAASVGITDPSKHAIVKDSVIVDTSTNINPSFARTIDCFVYYWALKLRKTIELSTGIDQMIESLIFSMIKMSFEIVVYSFNRIFLV